MIAFRDGRRTASFSEWVLKDREWTRGQLAVTPSGQ